MTDNFTHDADATPSTPQEVFDMLWEKHEPIARRMFQDAMEFLTDQYTGVPTANTLQTHMRMAYLAGLNAYACALDLEAADVADFKTSIEDMSTEGLPEE